MASKPILFNTEMVRAILDGRKTMTRRVIKDKDITNNFDIDVDGSAYAYINPETGDSYPPTAIAKYQTGDILWVRETWQDMSNDEGDYVYLADGDKGLSEWSITTKQLRWKPSIHMPREAARLFLRVTNVRVERLQEINEYDAQDEGVEGIETSWLPTHIVKFAKLWNSIYATPKAVRNKEGEILYYESYPWEDIQEVREYKGKPWYVYGNPWVFVYEFERVSEDGSRKDE